jgi:hypothetical protein
MTGARPEGATMAAWSLGGRHFQISKNPCITMALSREAETTCGNLARRRIAAFSTPC